MGLSDEIRHLRAAEPGRRFVEGHERTKVENRALRLFLVTLGTALMFAAAVTFWLPGPNFVLVLAGLALVAGQSRTVARLMDRGEVAARRWNDEHWDPYPHKRIAIVVIWLVVVTVLGAIVWYAHSRGWLPDWYPGELPSWLPLVD